MPPLTANQAGHAERLYRFLQASQSAPERVLELIRRVPRHLFLDRFYEHDPECGQYRAEPTPVTPATDDAATLAKVYSDHALCIDVRDGVCVSSTSQPSLVAGMIDMAGVAPGRRVLEIGTATGWNAALMAQIAGEVVSLEYDVALADRARERIGAVDRADRVTVLGADGCAGAPERAPFHAIVATVGCPGLAPAWREQLADGGVLLVPYNVPTGMAPLVRLTRKGDRLVGRAVSRTGFVSLRGEALPAWPEPLDPAGHPGLDELLKQPPRSRPLPWGGVAGYQSPTLWFAFYLLAAEHEHRLDIRLPDGDEAAVTRQALYDAEAGSLAVLSKDDICCYGSPSMGERLEAHAHAWLAAGAPHDMSYELEWVDEPPADGLYLQRPGSILKLTPPPRG